MGDELESEFERYKRTYEELKLRVERLSAYQRMSQELQSRMEDLVRQVQELAEEQEEGETEITWESRNCTTCGEPFISHLDSPTCPECRGLSEG
jgi:hypothetical protein